MHGQCYLAPVYIHCLFVFLDYCPQELQSENSVIALALTYVFFLFVCFLASLWRISKSHLNKTRSSPDEMRAQSNSSSAPSAPHILGLSRVLLQVALRNTNSPEENNQMTCVTTHLLHLHASLVKGNQTRTFTTTLGLQIKYSQILQSFTNQ